MEKPNLSFEIVTGNMETYCFIRQFDINVSSDEV